MPHFATTHGLPPRLEPVTALRDRLMQWVYLHSGTVLTASIAVVGVEGLAVIFEFSMLSPAVLPLILVGLAGIHWYRTRERRVLARGQF